MILEIEAQIVSFGKRIKVAFGELAHVVGAKASECRHGQSKVRPWDRRLVMKDQLSGAKVVVIANPFRKLVFLI
jgi:hypothetical protein